MWTITAVGPLTTIKAAADAFDELDPSPVEAVSWFEEGEGRFRIETYALEEESAQEAAALIQSLDLHATIAPVADADWVAMSLDGLPAVRAGRFLVAGAHALAQTPTGATRVWIEASEAFGTGHHGTTMGCLLALDDLLKRGRRVRRVLDVGAGSGVLAIAAAKCGAKAVAVEIDVRAAQIMDENVTNNRVRPLVKVIAGDGAPVARRGRRGFDLVFANILMRPLIRMSPEIAGAVAPGGVLVLSGLLKTQAPLVRSAYEGQRLRLIGRRRREGWATLIFTRSKTQSA
jgi:ribosomal protein L11 methyltransferase